MKNVRLKNKITHQNNRFMLSEEQYSLLLWLNNEEVLKDVVIEVYENYKYKEVEKKEHDETYLLRKLI